MQEKKKTIAPLNYIMMYSMLQIYYIKNIIN